MRVLHIFPSGHRGGSELCATETIKALSTDGIVNYAVFPADGDIVKIISGFLKGYIIIEKSWWLSMSKWSLIFKLKMLRGYFLTGFRIIKYIKDNDIDVVITHTLAMPSGALAAKLAGKPHVWYIHEYGDLDHGFRFCFGKNITLKIINALSRAIVVNSKALATHFIKYFPIDKLSIINYAVTYPLSKPISREENALLRLCMVGRIAPGKNQLIALLALIQLKQEGIMPHILFVGSVDQSYLNILNNIIAEHKLEDQVTFTGHSSEPWLYLQKSHVVIVCSKMEAFGRVTIEAMKSGKIAVVSETGAGKELIQHGKTGYLFNPDDADELASILKLIWNMNDDTQVAEAAYSFAVTNFNEDVHRIQFAKIFKEIV